MILVTGGTGLIGSHLLFKLALQNIEIRALKRSESNIENILKVFQYYSNDADSLFNKINWIEADLRDKCSLYKLFNNVTDIYHCAGYISFERRKKNNLSAINILGTTNMIDLALENNIRKFCYVSSIATLGDAEGDKLIDENTRWIPNKKSSFYSLSKYKAEMEVWRGNAEGLNTIIVNPSVVLGPGFWNGGSGLILKKISEGFNYYTEGSTGYIDARDVADIMIKLMNSDCTGEQYILTAENLTFKEVLNYFSHALKSKKKQKTASKLFMKILWRIEFIRSVLFNSSPLITKDSTKIAFQKSRYSNKKIIGKTGHEFIPIRKSVQFLCDKFLKEI